MSYLITGLLSPEDKEKLMKLFENNSGPIFRDSYCVWYKPSDKLPERKPECPNSSLPVLIKFKCEDQPTAGYYCYLSKYWYNDVETDGEVEYWTYIPELPKE